LVGWMLIVDVVIMVVLLFILECCFHYEVTTIVRDFWVNVGFTICNVLYVVVVVNC
jgi:hypothetical protein